MSRADYRRQLKIDEKLIAKGIDVAARDADQIISLMRVLRDKLRACAARSSVTSLMFYLYQSMTESARYLSDVPIACTKGCSHCCHIWVDAMPPEIFYTANSIRGGQRAQSIAAVDGAIAVTAGLSFDERGDMVTPCPLLADDLCSVYDVRPLVCRTAVSADANICKRSYIDVSGEDIPTPAIWMALRQGYGIALEGALHHAGLNSTAVEWNDALKIALTDGTAEARWFAGDDVFSAVQRPATPPLKDNPMYSAFYKEAFGVAP